MNNDNDESNTYDNLSSYTLIVILLGMSFGLQFIKCCIGTQKNNNKQNLLNNELKKQLTIDSNKECSICLASMNEYNNLIILDCKHYYHKICLNEWLKKSNTCPICRINL